MRLINVTWKIWCSCEWMVTLQAKNNNNHTHIIYIYKHISWKLSAEILFSFIPAHPVDEDNLRGTMYTFSISSNTEIRKQILWWQEVSTHYIDTAAENINSYNSQGRVLWTVTRKTQWNRAYLVWLRTCL